MLKRLFGRNTPPFVTVVSGLPRSGTSMMMKMLEAGGIDPIQDGIRSADSDNPKGYYEYERVKKLDKGDTAWVAQAQGKSVKVISALVQYLPPEQNYRVLFMHRNLDEVLASQARMLKNREEAAAVSDDELKQLYRKHVRQVLAWMQQQSNFQVLEVDYNAMLADVMGQLPQVNDLLGGNLKLDAMAAIVDPDLYRNRTV
jgi:ABC-type nitrate/sulfonate/bicarbonate transport system substrate-binding protein